MNRDADGEGWFFRIELDDPDAFEALLDEAAYAAIVETLDDGRSAELAALEAADSFVARHIGPSEADIAAMLHAVGAATLDELAAKTVPPAIRSNQTLDLPPPIDEAAVIAELRGLAARNVLKKSLIGMGYHGTHTPPVILRNVLENPGWYTAYTPYQAEIAQGRLEALLNFQTMICELTGMEIANASLLDEATAAAEAMAMAHAVSKTKTDVVAVAADLHPQTRAVLATRAGPLGIALVDVAPGDTGGDRGGKAVRRGAAISGDHRRDPRPAAGDRRGACGRCAGDRLRRSAGLVLLTPPGEMGADVVVGSSQRFGVPMGFGGPHAGFFATRDAYKRQMPGRLVGVSRGCRRRAGDAARVADARAAYPAREGDIEHLHGAGAAGGDRRDVRRVAWAGGAVAHRAAGESAGAHAGRRGARGGHPLRHDAFFDTIAIEAGGRADALMPAALRPGFNLRRIDADRRRDRARRDRDARGADSAGRRAGRRRWRGAAPAIPADARAQHGVPARRRCFTAHHAEHEMLRYLKRLEEKDIALNRSMIPLGSCTMKLNATAEMIPITWPGLADIHPFAPADQTEGYAS